MSKKTNMNGLYKQTLFHMPPSEDGAKLAEDLTCRDHDI